LLPDSATKNLHDKPSKQGNSSCPEDGYIGAKTRRQQRANNPRDTGRRTGDYETETRGARTAEVTRPRSARNHIRVLGISASLHGIIVRQIRWEVSHASISRAFGVCPDDVCFFHLNEFCRTSGPRLGIQKPAMRSAEQAGRNRGVKRQLNCPEKICQPLQLLALTEPLILSVRRATQLQANDDPSGDGLQSSLHQVARAHVLPPVGIVPFE
jgi:hypothetical protein